MSENQERIYQICEELSKGFESINCQILNFKHWLGDREFPVPEEKFDEMFAQYLMEDISRLKDGKVAFIEGKVVHFRITYEFKGFKNMNLKQQIDLYDQMEE